MICRSIAPRSLGVAFLLGLIPALVHAGFPGNLIEAGGQAVRDFTNGVDKLNEETTKVTTKANEEGTKITTKANEEGTNAGRGLNTAVTEEMAKQKEAATKGLETVNRGVTDGIQHAAEQAKKLNKNVKTNLEKVGRDLEAETGRFGRHLEDAAHAIGYYIERQGQGAGKTLSNAERRIREGKVVDAIWHLSTEPLQHTSENAAQATQESAYLNTVAQVAATAYGGPAGAAAYAAWLTFAQTGNADLALRAGILTFATSSAFAAAKGMDSATTSELAKKAAVTASIGGLAVAAAGGDPAAIKEGFLQAGAMVLVQDGYKKVAGSDIDGRASEGEGYCMTAQKQACSPPDTAYVKDNSGNIVRDPKGNPVINMSKLDPRRPHVGIWGGAGVPAITDERGAVMTSISRIPGMNAMAVFHDQWSISWDMGRLSDVVTIVPAIVLTYTGTGTNYYEHLRTTTVKSSGTPVAGVQPATVSRVPLPDGTVVKLDDTKVVADESLFVTTSAILSVACVAGEKERTFVVDVLGGGQSCRVVAIETGAAPTVLATSEETKSCIATVRDLVAKAQTTQSCFSRNTVNLLGHREPPPPVREAVNTLKGNILPGLSNFAVGLVFMVMLILPFVVLGYGARDLQHRVAANRAKRKNIRQPT